MTEDITPQTMQLNEVEPEGFCNEPRSLFFEVTKLQKQIAALYEAIGQLVELQREANTKLDGLLGKHPISDGETPAQVV
jgi:FtsZ-binding cell division protein ZapB